MGDTPRDSDKSLGAHEGVGAGAMMLAKIATREKQIDQAPPSPSVGVSKFVLRSFAGSTCCLHECKRPRDEKHSNLISDLYMVCKCSLL